MTLAANGQGAIIRTERGLTSAGTRITLYDVMEHLKAGWTPKLIGNGRWSATLTKIQSSSTDWSSSWQFSKVAAFAQTP